MKIVFFGTPHFAAEILRSLLMEGVEVAAVISKPDKPKGRSGAPQATPVKHVAEAHGVPVHQPEKVSDKAFAAILESYHADLFVVVAYGEILRQHVLDMPRLGCINVHPSQLPKYRGAAPIQRSIMEGETETAATIMYLVRKMDAGDIIKGVNVSIGPDMTFGELEEVLRKVGTGALYEVIQEFEQGSVQGTPQDDAKATHAAKIELEDCEIHWNEPAQKIHNLIRGTNPYPVAWCWADIKGQRKRVKILRSKLTDNPPGWNKANGLVIACGQGNLQILELQIEGKKVMTPEELFRGMSFDLIFFKT